MRKLLILFLLGFVLPASAQWGTGASAGTFNFYISGVAAALSDSARLKAGSNVTITKSGNEVTIAANAGTGITPAGARQHTGWTAQGAAIAQDTVVSRIEWGGAANASMKIFDADNDSVKFIPQSLSPIAVTDGATVLFNVDSTGNVGLGTASFGTNATQTLAIANGTAPTSSPANTFQLYSGSGEANIRDVNGLVSTLTHEYGTLIRNGATTLSLSTNTYAKVTFSLALTSQGVTTVTDSITVIRAGVYQVLFNMSATTAAGSDNYTVSIFINQSQAANAETLTTLSTTNTSVFAMFQFALAANDDIAIMVKNTTDADDITVNRAALILNRVD